MPQEITCYTFFKVLADEGFDIATLKLYPTQDDCEKAIYELAQALSKQELGGYAQYQRERYPIGNREAIAYRFSPNDDYKNAKSYAYLIVKFTLGATQ